MIKKLFGILTVCLLMGLCACGGVNIKADKDYNKYLKEEFCIEGNDDVVKLDFLNLNDKEIIYQEYTRSTKNNNEFIITFFIYDLDKGEKRKINIDSSIGEIVHNASMIEEGNILLWGWNDEIFIVDSEGKIMHQNSINSVLNEIMPEKDFGSTVSIYDIYAENDYIYIDVIADQEYLCILDYNLQGKLVEKGEWLFFTSRSDVPQLYNWTGNQMYTYDVNKNVLNKNGIKLDSEEYVSANILPGDSYYDYYYYNFSRTYSPSESFYNLIGVKDQKMYKVFDFNNMNIKQEKVCINGIHEDGQGGFWIVSQPKEKKSIEILHLIEDNQVHDYTVTDERKSVVIGGIYFPSIMEYLVYDFNEESTDYRIELLNYAEKYGDYNDALTHFNIDILNGNVLDGISLYGLDIENLKDKGVLENLNTYFERDEVDKDRFTKFFIDNITDKEGRINYIYPSYIVSGYGYSEVIDFDDLTRYQQLIERNKLFFGGNREEILIHLLRYSGNKYIDIESKEIHIDTLSFKSLLKLLEKETNTTVSDVEPTIIYNRGEAETIEAKILYPTWYFYYEMLMGEDVKFSLPGTDGPIVDAMTFLLGVDARSDQKEGMYQFIDYMYSPAIYYNWFMYEGFPVMEFAWEEWKKILTSDEDYINCFGDLCIVADMKIGFREAQRIINKGEVTEEQFDEMRSVIESSTWVEPLPDKYIDIILEEANAYFAGQKELVETCRILEERLRNALDE